MNQQPKKVVNLMDLQQETKPTSQHPLINIPAPVKKQARLGDMLKKITAKIGITPCGGCQKRADILNNLVGFRPINKHK